ncbi:tRNA (mnm(5)s(2)U34)-methyltransferase [Eubacterium barkeri]|uniref:Putative rRNA methylase n=1 Tax=Eubacterium barkeri TaxID=1528 RepID=A0A1H3EDP9_EUBBA|nr:class I SAM-dependent methyltransferase [Eubacterium barkeri]SDX76836.1 Putative rRNA methylase [Eubacterium barkeri]
MIEAFRRQTILAGSIIWEHLNHGDSAIDGTAGAGEDTLMMARRVGPEGRVYAFDIQGEAIARTRSLLASQGVEQPVRLYHLGHESLGSLPEISGDPRIRGIMFNLGYLPGGDHAIVTRCETTIAALKGALGVLAADGVMTVCVYGHQEGLSEAQGVEAWCSALGKGIDVHRIETINHQNSPVLYLIKKARDVK